MNTSDVQAQKRRYGIVGNSEGLNHAVDIALQVAKTDLSVLITGESGVGKEIIPRIIHDNSLRKTKKYFAVNCGSIPEGTIDSELFGHEKGAFTGAIGEREGYFGAANGGTLFLDEVAEMPLSMQAKFLRALQERVVTPIGGTESINVDVRVVAATNRDLFRMVEEGKFREDLYYRLNIIPIELPPLRKRKEDLPALIEYYIAYYNQKLGKSMRGVSPEALQTLTSYDWPGNVREMKNIIEYLENIAEGEIIQLSDLPDHIVMRSGKGFEDWSLDEIVEDYEKRVLSSMVKKGATLEEKNQLAENLKISRATLYRKLKKYDLL